MRLTREQWRELDYIATTVALLTLAVTMLVAAIVRWVTVGLDGVSIGCLVMAFVTSRGASHIATLARLQ